MSPNYQELWDTCIFHDIPTIESAAKRILRNKPAYDAVVEGTSIPWYCIGVTHYRESSCNFATHPHNGDSLLHKTVNVPAGRIPDAEPPYTWEQSAKDCYLTLKKWDKKEDWSIPAMLQRLEGFNGFGYRDYHPEVLSPYLWSYTDKYTKGKYASDGKFDPELVDKQVGIAPLLSYLTDKTIGLV